MTAVLSWLSSQRGLLLLGLSFVIGAVGYLLVASWARHESWYRGRVIVPASMAIAAVGLFWTVQRVLS